jgi:hypothetical protein
VTQKETVNALAGAKKKLSIHREVRRICHRGQKKQGQGRRKNKAPEEAQQKIKLIFTARR